MSTVRPVVDIRGGRGSPGNPGGNPSSNPPPSGSVPPGLYGRLSAAAAAAAATRQGPTYLHGPPPPAAGSPSPGGGGEVGGKIRPASYNRSSPNSLLGAARPGSYGQPPMGFSPAVSRPPEHPSLRYVQYSPRPPVTSTSAAAAAAVAAASEAIYIQSTMQGGGGGGGVAAPPRPYPLNAASSSSPASNFSPYPQQQEPPRVSSHPRLSLRPPYSTNVVPGGSSGGGAGLYHNETYMRDVQAAAAHRSQPPPSSLPAGIHLPSRHSQTQSTLSTVAAVQGMEIPPKRPRMDLGHPSSSGNSLSIPLRIDTREPSKDSGYHPQVEAISPTGPEASAERDDLRSTKDDLLQKITKVDREIAKAESQIAKLKKKQQELEDTANRPSSDSNEEDEKPKNQSVAQIIYAENRKKAREAHAMLDKLAPPNELPLYNQPSDTVSYHENKTNHAHFKKQLVEYFKKRNEERESRERHMTETYSKLTTIWLKKVEKLENSKKRREKEQRARDLYEKIFPELRKQREDKERDHRLGTRGAVRSEADIENVIERLQEQELENQKMHSYAVIPPLLLPLEERRRKFINNNGLILDPLKEYEERKFLNTWTDEEKQTFKERFLQHPKNFGLIAQSLDRKNVADAVQYYYLSKKTETYKQIIRKNRTGSRRRKVQPSTPEVIGPNAHGVVTRHRNREQEKMEPNENNDISNRSTPVLKSENNIKSEDFNEEDSGGDKKIKKEPTNDTSDDEESSQIKSGPPHPCAVCKATVEASRPVHSKGYALQLGLREEDVNSESRVCNKCHCIALRKRHGHCPIPTCTSTKGRGFKVKNRFRHLPSKWAELPDEIKGPIIAEMQLPEGIKKCCSGCVTRLTRKISQASNSGGVSNNMSVKSEEDVVWAEEDIELMKTCLRESGRNWGIIGEKIREKTPEQCKKFFYNNRKKYSLDKIVLDFKRANQSGDQPPTLSTDEESGSSTSSCDEETSYNNNVSNPTPSSSSSGVPISSASSSLVTSAATNPAAVVIPSGRPTPTTSSPPDNDIQVKSENNMVKAPAPPPHENNVIKSEDSIPPHLPPPAPVKTTLVKEEDNDSSTTMSADEVEMNNATPRSSIYSSSQAYLSSASGGPREMGRFGGPPPRGFQPPGGIPVQQQQQRSLGESFSNGPVREVITVKDLMSNVIERQLSNNQVSHHHGQGLASAGGGGGSNPGSSIANPTIHTILENSGPAPHKTNYIRDRIGLNPLQKSTASPMAPPPPPTNNDCETLDLSMPRRRDSSPINSANNNGAAERSASQYREPVVIHRSTASSYSTESSGGNRASTPPPAHSGSKVVTVPDPFRDLTPGGRGIVYPPPDRHLLNRPRAPPLHSNLRFGVRQAAPLMAKGPCKSGGGVKVEKQLLIQSGSITQGTPVNHHSSRGALPGGSSGSSSSSYEPLLRVTPSDKPSLSGSITHGTPVYDKKDSGRLYDRKVDYYGTATRTLSPGSAPRYPQSSSSAAASVVVNSEPPSQLSSRAVIMNDFAMARSNEMQRRPDSREQQQQQNVRSASPRYQSRDLSPRTLVDHQQQQRILSDPRATLTAAVERSSARYNSSASQHHRVLQDVVRGDPKAELATLTRPSVEIRGDPRAGLEISSRPSAASVIDYRNEGGPRRHEASPSRPSVMDNNRANIERHRAQAISAAMAAAASAYPPGYPLYMTPDGKYVPMHPRRSPSRSTPPPPPSSSAGVSRGGPRGGITTGKPVVMSNSRVDHIGDYYRGHPEVTISKTNSSPRLASSSTIYNDSNPLNSLVDVAVKQPKLPDPKLLEHSSKDGKSPATVSSAAAAVAALHQQQTRMVAAAAAAAAQQQQKFVDRYLPASNTQQLEAALAAVAAASSSADFSKQQQQANAEQERQKQQQNLYKSLIHNDYGQSSSSKASSSSSISLHVQTPASSSVAASITPHKIIDAIIHQQQEYNHQQQQQQQQQLMGKYRRSPAVLESGDLDKQTPPYKVPSRSPSLKSDPTEERPGSRPSSREHEPYLKKEDYHWRRREEGGSSSRQTPPGRLAPDERQITRVAQQQASPRSEKSPPEQQQSHHQRYMVDPRRRLVEAAAASSKTPGGMFTVEYVNNKIVEEMKKNNEGSSSSSMAPPSASSSSKHMGNNSSKPGLKRHIEEESESPRKRLRDNDNELLPDSPGSGEMVIDESARPDSVSSHKTTSPAGNRSASDPPIPRYEPLSDDE